jgi:hypothetical protein
MKEGKKDDGPRLSFHKIRILALAHLVKRLLQTALQPNCTSLKTAGEVRSSFMRDIAFYWAQVAT